MENIKLKIGKRIREIRVEKGYSQEKLALLSELDRTYIPSIENGKRNISIVVLNRITDALEIQLSDFFKSIDN